MGDNMKCEYPGCKDESIATFIKLHKSLCPKHLESLEFFIWANGCLWSMASEIAEEKLKKDREERNNKITGPNVLK
jgi:hypothetical protein